MTIGGPLARAAARSKRPQEVQRDHRGAEREGDAADPDRAFEAGSRNETQDQRREPVRPMGEPDQQKTGEQYAGGRCQMLRRPGHLEQPAAQPRRLANEGGVQQGAERSGSGQHDHDESRRHLAGEPRGEADHHQKGGEGSEPGERCVRLPAAHPRQDGNDGRAEVPKIIVSDAVRHATLAEERVFGRNPRADHLVDQRDLGVIEDGGGQRHALGRRLRKHRDCRRERQQGRGRHDGCDRQERLTLGQGRPLQDAGRNSNDGKDGRDDEHRGLAHPDPAQERQHDDVVDRPSQRRRPQPAGRRLCQPQRNRRADQSPKRQHDRGAKEGVLDMSHVRAV